MQYKSLHSIRLTIRLNKFKNEFNSTIIIFIIKLFFLILTFAQQYYIFNILIIFY